MAQTDDNIVKEYANASFAFNTSGSKKTGKDKKGKARDNLEGVLARKFNAVSRTIDERGYLIIAHPQSYLNVGTLVGGHFGYTLETVELHLQGNALANRQLFDNLAGVHILQNVPNQIGDLPNPEDI